SQRKVPSAPASPPRRHGLRSCSNLCRRSDGSDREVRSIRHDVVWNCAGSGGQTKQRQSVTRETQARAHTPEAGGVAFGGGIFRLRGSSSSESDVRSTITSAERGARASPTAARLPAPTPLSTGITSVEQI
ncbi:hypothetical protein HW555_000258, partial [Spodoptera exigua]